MKKLEDIKKFLDPRWHTKPEKNSFVFNIILGISIMLIFSFVLKDTRPKQDMINWNFDNYTLWRMSTDENSFIDKYLLFQKAADIETKHIAQELFFLNFDDDSIKTLNHPIMMPRNKVADLINVAYQNKAAIVIVDIDFSQPDYSPAKMIPGDNEALTGSQRDKILYDLLKTIRDDTKSDTKVLLMRSTYSDQIEYQNIFSDLIDGKKIFEITPNASEYEAKERFWLPYTKATSQDTGQTRILWSAPIMTMALTIGNLDELHDLEQKILNDADKKMDTYYLTVNRQGVIEKFPLYEEQYNGGGIVRNTQAEQYNRIQYVLFPSDLKSSSPIIGNIDPGHQRSWRRNGISNVERFHCQGKIVTIGRADKECEDIHITPVGRMPGMYINANAIATVLSSSRPHLCSITMHVVIEFLLVIIAAYVFLNLKGPKVGYIILFMFVSCSIFQFFYYCFTNEYIYLNMAFMSLGVYNVSKVIENVSWKVVADLAKFISIKERK